MYSESHNNRCVWDYRVGRYNRFPDIVLYLTCSVPSNIKDRPIPLLCHFISCPVLPVALSAPFHHYLCNKVHISSKKEPKHHQYFVLLIIIFKTLLPLDGIVKCNGPLSHFSVNRTFQIIQCWISQLLLYILSCHYIIRNLYV